MPEFICTWRLTTLSADIVNCALGLKLDVDATFRGYKLVSQFSLPAETTNLEKWLLPRLSARLYFLPRISAGSRITRTDSAGSHLLCTAVSTGSRITRTDSAGSHSLISVVSAGSRITRTDSAETHLLCSAVSAGSRITRTDSAWSHLLCSVVSARSRITRTDSAGNISLDRKQEKQYSLGGSQIWRIVSAESGNERTSVYPVSPLIWWCSCARTCKLMSETHQSIANKTEKQNQTARTKESLLGDLRPDNRNMFEM